MSIKAVFKMVVLAAGWCAGLAQADAIFGAGATFPNAIYQAWGKAYQTKAGTILIYTPVGSGKGIAEIVAARTDFGASDKPLKLDELEKHQLVQFPAVIGGVVPAINIKGIGDGQLLLDADTLAAIYLGKITHWNDPALLALNPGLALPNAEIAVVYRSDKSGTTFNFTNYLSKANPEWKSAMGEGLTVAWKVGEGGNGNSGVAKKVVGTPNAIGYMDMAELQKRGLTYTKMKNRDGVSVSPSAQSFAAAAASAKWSVANGFYEILTDEPGKESWPITAATFILLERTPALPEHVAEVMKFFDWAYRNGGQLANGLNYVPLPDVVADSVRNAWKTQVKDEAGKALWQ
jgi:phosphate transport system substrate-binding protein